MICTIFEQPSDNQLLNAWGQNEESEVKVMASTYNTAEPQ